MNKELDQDLILKENLWKNPVYVLDLLKSISFINLAIIVNYFAVRFATLNAGAPVGDLLFKILPYVDTSFIHKYIILFLYLGTIITLIIYQKKFPFLINCFALLILVRSVFINLTYLGTPVGMVPVKTFFTQGGDLFFSGHVALPFMVALVYWENKYLRFTFLLVTVFMSLEVLLGRYHYSIDVFAGLFITYGVFAFYRKFFSA